MLTDPVARAGVDGIAAKMQQIDRDAVIDAVRPNPGKGRDKSCSGRCSSERQIDHRPDRR